MSTKRTEKENVARGGRRFNRGEGWHEMTDDRSQGEKETLGTIDEFFRCEIFPGRAPFWRAKEESLVSIVYKIPSYLISLLEIRLILLPM